MKLPLIGNLFKARPDRVPAETPKSPLGVWKDQKRQIVEYKNVVAAEYALQHPVIFRCLHKLASSVAQVKWYAEANEDMVAADRAGASVIKDLNALLDWPNDTLAPDQLRYWMTLCYAVYGRVPFKVGTGVSGAPNGIYPLDARHVQGITDGRGSIKEYKYGNMENGETYPTRRTAQRAKSNKPFIHEIYTPNLAASLDSGKNITVLGAIGLPAEVINMLLKRAYDTASGHPNTKYIVTSEKTLTTKQRDAIKEHIEDSAPGGEESGNILFLFNTKVDVHKLDNDLSDIHSKMPSDDMARMICGSFGIPIALIGLGAADGAKFAGNYTESRRSFWEDTIIPTYLTPIATGLTQALCPPGARIRFDIDTIDAIQDARVSRSKELTDVSFLTMDEKRELAGYPALTPEQRAKLEAEAAMAKPAAQRPPSPVATPEAP